MRPVVVKLVTLLLCACPALSCSVVTGGSGEEPGGAGPADPGSGGPGSPGGAPPTSGAGAGAAPAITDLAYVPGPDGPRTLVRGTASALEALLVELLDASGAPADVPEGSTLTVLPPPSSGGIFLVELQAAPGFEARVAAVAVTPEDDRGRRGARRVASLAPLPVREAGQACDPDGFDRCAEGGACLPGLRGAANTCAEAAAARAARCAAAPLVEVGAGASHAVRGEAVGASLWEPDAACVPAGRAGRPETVVRLRVRPGVSDLELATAGADFDTVLSLHERCDAPSLACNDDDPAPTSKLALHAPAPGDYFVVVDSLDREGGAFELRATAR